MFNSPIGSGAQLFFIIVLVAGAFVTALSVVDFLKVKDKEKDREEDQQAS